MLMPRIASGKISIIPYIYQIFPVSFHQSPDKKSWNSVNFTRKKGRLRALISHYPLANLDENKPGKNKEERNKYAAGPGHVAKEAWHPYACAFRD